MRAFMDLSIIVCVPRNAPEVAIMTVPPLIERETFEAVQARLKSRNPMVTPWRDDAPHR